MNNKNSCHGYQPPLLLGVVAADGVRGRGQQVFIGSLHCSLEQGLSPLVAVQLVLHLHFDAPGEVLQRAVLEAVPRPQGFGVREGGSALVDPTGAPNIVLQIGVNRHPRRAAVLLLLRGPQR